MSSPIALFDASVLYPAPLRDFLMYLTLTDTFRAKWSEAIHQEWIEALLRNRPDLTRTRLERTRDLMNAHVLDAVVEGYEELVDQLSLPDPDDRHVLAAAIKGDCDLIVTFNLKDFPDEILATYKIKAQHPDTFVMNLIDIAPFQVIFAASEHRQSLKNPPKSITEYLTTLEQHGLTQTVANLRAYAPLI